MCCVSAFVVDLPGCHGGGSVRYKCPTSLGRLNFCIGTANVELIKASFSLLRRVDKLKLIGHQIDLYGSLLRAGRWFDRGLSRGLNCWLGFRLNFRLGLLHLDAGANHVPGRRSLDERFVWPKQGQNYQSLSHDRRMNFGYSRYTIKRRANFDAVRLNSPYLRR